MDRLNFLFHLQALSASNLEIVMMLCEAVNPSQVFNQIPCPLHQPVLLSLIQQLSADLENSTILKHKYVQKKFLKSGAGCLKLTILLINVSLKERNRITNLRIKT